MKITQDYLVLSPAYGRVYNTRQAALDDFAAGKDFVNESRHLTGGGTYCSVRDFAQDVKVEIYLRKGGRSIIAVVAPSGEVEEML